MVAGVLTRGRAVLVARRPSGGREAGLWEFPGGKVEPGESDAQALVRELSEELGVTVVVHGALGESVHAYSHGQVRLVALTCTADGEPRALEHAELRWLSADTLHSVEWAPADVPLLDAVARALGRSSIAGPD